MQDGLCDEDLRRLGPEDYMLQTCLSQSAAQAFTSVIRNGHMLSCPLYSKSPTSIW